MTRGCLFPHGLKTPRLLHQEKHSTKSIFTGRKANRQFISHRHVFVDRCEDERFEVSLIVLERCI